MLLSTAQLRVLSVLLASISLWLGGCSSQPQVSTDSAELQFRLLGRYYGEYLAGHGGRAPEREEEFLRYLQEFAQYLQSRGIAQPADLLISPRDHQPLRVLYGQDIIEDGPGGLPWVGYEQQGVDGRRYLIGARGVATEVSPEEFEQTISASTNR